MPLRTDELRRHQEGLAAIKNGTTPIELAIIPSNLMLRKTPDIVLVTARLTGRAGDIAIIMRWASKTWQGARTVAVRHLAPVPPDHPDLAEVKANLGADSAKAAA